MKAGAVSLRVKLLLKTAMETELTKQKDIQMVGAGLLPSLGPMELSASCHLASAIPGSPTFFICASLFCLLRRQVEERRAWGRVMGRQGQQRGRGLKEGVG